MWDIDFYVKPNGRCPVKEFFGELSKTDDLPYVMNALDQLAEHGHNLQRPQAAYLGDDIYELRVRVIKKQIRVLYFFFDEDGKIILTNGLIKKSAQVPSNDIRRAKEYRQDYITRSRGGKKK